MNPLHQLASAPMAGFGAVAQGTGPIPNPASAVSLDAAWEASWNRTASLQYGRNKGRKGYRGGWSGHSDW